MANQESRSEEQQNKTLSPSCISQLVFTGQQPNRWKRTHCNTICLAFLFSFFYDDDPL